MARNQTIYTFVAKNVFLSLTVISQIGNQLEIRAKEDEYTLRWISIPDVALAIKRMDSFDI